MPCAIIPLSGGGDEGSLTAKKTTRSQSLDFYGVPPLSLHTGSSGAPRMPEAIYAEPEPIRPRTNTLPERSPSKSRSRLCSIPPELDASASGSCGRGGKPVPAPRRSYLRAVESTKTEQRSDHIYAVPFANAGQDAPSKCTYRHLAFDPNSNAYTQSKPPALPPKMGKKSRKPESEPVYAQVDLAKKVAERSTKAKAAERYAKAQQAVISSCKLRMEEVQANEEKDATRSETGPGGSSVEPDTVSRVWTTSSVNIRRLWRRSLGAGRGCLFKALSSQRTGRPVSSPRSVDMSMCLTNEGDWNRPCFWSFLIFDSTNPRVSIERCTFYDSFCVFSRNDAPLPRQSVVSVKKLDTSYT